MQIGEKMIDWHARLMYVLLQKENEEISNNRSANVFRCCPSPVSEFLEGHYDRRRMRLLLDVLEAK